MCQPNDNELQCEFTEEEINAARENVRFLHEVARTDITIEDIESALKTNYATFRSWYQHVKGVNYLNDKLHLLAELYEVAVKKLVTFGFFSKNVRTLEYSFLDGDKDLSSEELKKMEEFIEKNENNDSKS